MAKLFTSEAAWRCADRCVQAFGGRGYLRSNVAERFLRELRVDRIWEGTSEIQRLVDRPRARAPRRRADASLDDRSAGLDPVTATVSPGCSSPARSPSSARPTAKAPTATRCSRNLERLGYDGELWGVNPKRDRIRDVPCVPTLARPARAPSTRSPSRSRPSRVPDAIDDAVAIGCGGAVVVSAGFGEVESRPRARGAPGRDRADAASFPVCGPNGNGIVNFPARAGALGRLGPGIARGRRRDDLAERQRRRQRARLAPRDRLPHRDLDRQPGGLRRQRLARRAERAPTASRSIAMFLESDGDGERFAAALAGLRRARDRRRGPQGRLLGGGRRRRRRPHRLARRRPADLPGAGRGVRRLLGPRPPRAARARPGPRRAARPARPGAAGSPS